MYKKFFPEIMNQRHILNSRKDKTAERNRLIANLAEGN